METHSLNNIFLTHFFWQKTTTNKMFTDEREREIERVREKKKRDKGTLREKRSEGAF